MQLRITNIVRATSNAQATQQSGTVAIGRSIVSNQHRHVEGGVKYLSYNDKHCFHSEYNLSDRLLLL